MCKPKIRFSLKFYAGLLMLGLLCSRGHADNAIVPPQCLPTEGRIPSWIDANDSLLRERYFQAWRLTTTTLCVNLKHLRSDNSTTVLPSILWAATEPLLFRGSYAGLPPAEAFRDGLVPRKPDGGILQMKAIDQPAQSGVVSTSRSASYGASFGKYLFVMSAPGGVDVDASVGGDRSFSGGNEDEVAFPGGVRTEFVRGAFTTSTDNKSDWGRVPFSGYAVNPVFRAPSDQPGLPVPEGSVDIFITRSGEGYGSIFMKNESNHEMAFVTRISDRDTIMVRATDEREQPRTLMWWANGHLASTRSSCVQIPASLNLSRNLFVDATTRDDYVLPVSATCAKLDAPAIFNGRFDEQKVPTGVTSIAFVSNEYGWKTSDTGVQLLSRDVAKLPSSAQAVELSAEFRSPYESPVAGGIQQQLMLWPYLRWTVSFKMRSNHHAWCAKGLPLGGVQHLRVSLVDPRDGKPIWMIDHPAFPFQQDFEIPANAQTDSGSLISEEWQMHKMQINLLKQGGIGMVRPVLKFLWQNERNDSCSPLIADVSIEPAQ